MTARPSDDELRAMLEGRAASVSTGAAREVLAGARAAIAGPTGRDGAGVAFLPRPVARVRHRSRAPWGIAAVAAAAVVVVALLGGRVQPDRPSASHPVAGASQGPAASDRSVLLSDITIGELRSRLRSGELDGKTVVMPGRLYQEYGRCRLTTPSLPGSDCTWLRIDGVENVVIDRGGRSVDEVQAEIDRFGQSAPLVLRGVDRNLELVGWLTIGADEPVQVGELGSHVGSLTGGSMALVDGWLIGGSPTVSCPVATLPAPPCRGADPWLTASEPLPDGTPIYGEAGHSVLVDPGLALHDAPAELAGPFLIRENEDRANSGFVFDVVARLDRSTTVWVQQPRTDLAGSTIPAADVMAALGDGSLDGQLLAIDGELKGVAWECPLDARPCLRFYVDGLAGIAVTWDGALQGSFASPGAPVSVMEGRLLVTPRNGYLKLLGRLDGDLDRPIGLGELPATDLPPWPDPLGLRAVNGWLLVDGPIYCSMIRPGAGDPCPPAHSFLTPFEPAPSGDPTSPLDVPVALHRGAPGIDALPIRQAGPFLVRYDVVGSTCDGVANGDAVCAGGPRLGWIVEGAYDPGSVRVVTFP